ncbi:MAG: M24 family metallopeptidase [Fimbriimonadaceae bacterium]
MSATNLARLQAAMVKQSVPAMVISDIANVAWVSGFTGSSAIVLVTPDAARLLTDSRYTIQVAEEVRAMSSFSFANPTTQVDFLAAHIGEMKVSKLAFEGGSLTYDTWQKWTSKTPNVELYPAPDVLGPLRMVKSDEEVAGIRAACALADAAFDHVRRFLRPGATEYDIGLEIEFFFRRNGADIAFPPIVASGERSARPHGHPSEKRLEIGDFVTLDFGAKLDGQCSDMTRTVVIGEASERQSQVYAAVLNAQLAGLRALKPGASAKDVDAVARKVLGEAGLAEFFGHGLGHGLGSVVHDLGRLAPTSTDTVEVGQVWTIEPGVYIPGFGGVRIEDDALVTEAGPEILNRTPKDLLTLPV